ncbi:MAG TPA: PQQ-dependent sugar dehydrogenase [Bryobacteraceae bacterium]|jgi:glucose/arabinose dehydrogenase
MKSPLFSALIFATLLHGQANVIDLPRAPLGDGPFIFDTAEQHKIKVTVITKALHSPFGIAFLPGGNILVSERGGALRIVRDGVLDPQPVSGVPPVNARANAGLYDFVLHPQYALNQWIYFAFSKAAAGNLSATVLARAKLQGNALTQVQELYSTEPGTNVGGSRLAFAQDGKILMTTPAAGVVEQAQDPASAYGKILRLNDDGTIPRDNPFVGKAGYRPEIYTLGHRDQLGLVVHSSGTIFNAEHGPNGGDEVNLLKPGANYGWPVISFGRQYDGTRIPTFKEGMEIPQIVWVPSIGPSGIMFYTGDKFPAWKNNLFVGSARYGEIRGFGHLERVVLNDKFEDIRREMILGDLHQRFRDVRQGPDGNIYALTDQEVGALLRIEPAQ